ncbi:hypothetical protein GCM10027276_10620 [Comamonas piscis]
MNKLLRWKKWLAATAVVLCVLVAVAWHQSRSVKASQHYATISLLIPDSMAADTPEVEIWREAARERGVLLTPLRISEWMRGMNYGAPAAQQAVILPDTFHRNISDAAVQTLIDMVHAGGQAMVVQDGGMLDERGYYSKGSARLSQMLGVRYGDYDSYKDQLSDYEEIRGAPATMTLLGIPPGRYLDAKAAAKLTAIDPEELAVDEPGFPSFIAGYTKDSQRFTVLKTDRPMGGPRILLQSSNGDVVASLNRWGKGQALFVNLPLTYLLQRTDGIFLHGFLGYFAQQVVERPALLASPDGIGALVLNWHNDDGKAIGFLHALQEAGIFDHGHQSLHFTAGPDVNTQGDGLGMDLDDNNDAQQMIQKLLSQGHSIGNHGGWIHNYFGNNASDDNADDFMPFLDLNNASVTKANRGRQPTEYSAPNGNTPLWTYDWMAEHGVQAFYTVANVGMPPTRLWLGKRQVKQSWAFPVLTYGQVASAEEASFQKMPVAEFGQWLQQVARFIEQTRSVRLSYFHPIGAVDYLPAVKDYIDSVQACADRKQCQFISMTEAADFLSRRDQVQWSLQAQGNDELLTASHPQSLASMAWTLPKTKYAAVRVRAGEAEVQSTDDAWLVRVRGGKELSLELRRQP